ncbi:unnamed protein product [Staurois parvus]|uniref:Uncharacterized protein n=1 Tax=Staurois parvus TaxID=386267 RepID=A0ABN9DC29_9NEOB|nr:unnamed protein product [Staurois parvus]
MLRSSCTDPWGTLVFQ